MVVLRRVHVVTRSRVLHDCVESIVVVSGVGDLAYGAIGLQQRVSTLYDVAVTDFVLRLVIPGVGILNGVRVLVFGVGVCVMSIVVGSITVRSNGGDMTSMGQRSRMGQGGNVGDGCTMSNGSRMGERGSMSNGSGVDQGRGVEQGRGAVVGIMGEWSSVVATMGEFLMSVVCFRSIVGMVDYVVLRRY